MDHIMVIGGGKVISNVIEAQGLPFLVDGGPDTLVTRKTETNVGASKAAAEERQTLSPALVE